MGFRSLYCNAIKVRCRCYKIPKDNSSENNRLKTED